MRRFVDVCCGELFVSLSHILRETFSGSKIDISTVNTSLTGVFVDKEVSIRQNEL